MLACACACTRMRTSTGSSLAEAWAVTAGAPVTSRSVRGGRAEFVLHGEEAQTNSSANSDLRVFEAWMSWLHGSQPPDPLAFIRRAACRTAFTTPSPGCRRRQGVTRKVEIRSFVEFDAHRWVVCMHVVWHKLDIHGQAPKRSFEENPRQV